jgi:HEPN domain-containing protein
VNGDPTGDPNADATTPRKNHVSTFVKQPDHWLYRREPHEWIRVGLAELDRAQKAYEGRDARAGLATAKRAAGMGLNGALCVEPNEAWGRSYVDHVVALSKDAGAPEAVREACRRLLQEQPSGHAGSLLTLHTKGSNERILDAVKTVLAHAYAIVVRHDPTSADQEDEGS